MTNRRGFLGAILSAPLAAKSAPTKGIVTRRIVDGTLKTVGPLTSSMIENAQIMKGAISEARLAASGLGISNEMLIGDLTRAKYL